MNTSLGTNKTSFVELVTEITAAASHGRLHEILNEAVREYGVVNIAYVSLHLPTVPEEKRVTLVTYDESWQRTYLDQEYEYIDPVVAHANSMFLPLDWTEIDKNAVFTKDFFREAERYGVGRQGVTLPIRGRSGERALMTITSNDDDEIWAQKRYELMKEFQLLSHYYHERAIQLSGLRSFDKVTLLTGREKQCLDLTAKGFVPKRISMQLKISDTAVRMFLRSACNKLDCVTVEQAVGKMVALEVIKV